MPLFQGDKEMRIYLRDQWQCTLYLGCITNFHMYYKASFCINIFGLIIAVILDLEIQYVIVSVSAKHLVSQVDKMSIIEYILLFQNIV